MTDASAILTTLESRKFHLGLIVGQARVVVLHPEEVVPAAARIQCTKSVIKLGVRVGAHRLMSQWLMRRPTVQPWARAA